MVPESKAHGAQQLPEKVWLGCKDGEWPIFAFESEGAAQRWQAEHDQTRVRRIWEVSTEHAVERIVKVVPQELGWA